MCTKLWPVTEALSQHLSLVFGLKVRPKGLQVQLSCLGSKEVRAAVPILSMIGGSSFDLGSHILVVGHEGATELRKEQTAVAISIVAAQE